MFSRARQLIDSHFSSLAGRAFATSPRGERLFCRGGPWSRLYVISDLATEQRLFELQKRHYQWVQGGVAVMLAVVVPVAGDRLMQTPWFFAYMAAVVAYAWVVGVVLFRGELRGLPRASVRFAPAAFFAETARTHPAGALALGFVGSLAFVAGGFWMRQRGSGDAVGWFIIAFFGLIAIAWGFCLILKLTGWAGGASVRGGTGA